MLGLRALRVRSHVISDCLCSRRLLLQRYKTASSDSEDAPATRRHQQWKRREDVLRNAPASVYIGFALVTFLGFMGARLVHAIVKASSDGTPTELSQQKDVAAKYDEIADTFDGEVSLSEWLMGLFEQRKRLTQRSIGNVLEVSCGTGRNLGYYELDNQKLKIKSLTLLDLSPQMIQVCRRKFLALRANQSKDKKTPGNDTVVRFVAGSALDEMPLAPDGNKYDTIIQTMGLCSTPAPMELVVNMARHLNLRNPQARIYLLEHGRSHYNWLNKIIDTSASKHAEEYGCWYNRDLDAIVGEAAERSGFEVVRSQRKHFGTTFIFELKPGPKAAEKLKEQELMIQPAESAMSTWQKWFQKPVS